MLVDFANEALYTKIITNSLTTDGYEASNLIENKNTQMHCFQRKHFMSEYYVKCPVKVLLTFPYLVDVSAIVLNPCGSTHRSKCIEIHATYQKPILNKQKELPCIYPLDLSDFKPCRSMNIVGKYNERHQGNHERLVKRIIFQNKHHELQYTDHHTENLHIPLKPLACVSACSNLLLNITWATVPIIGDLEIWGTPSSRNPSTLKHSIDVFLKSTLKFDKSDYVLSEISELKPCLSRQKAESILDSDQSENGIPQEFIDPITLSMMTIPMLLPSGNNIDKTTYDKFVAAEELYGRLPSDPFTGVVFQGSRKPIPNTSLKLRIDEHILKYNVDKTPQVYMLGSSTSTSVHTKRDLKPPTNTETKSQQSSQLKVITKVKETKNRKATYDHQSELEDSLNDGVSATLSSLPNCFSKKIVKVARCVRCMVSERKILYQLPCSHHCCRNCLQVITKDGKSCPNCSKPFKHQDVMKVE